MAKRANGNLLWRLALSILASKHRFFSKADYYHYYSYTENCKDRKTSYAFSCWHCKRKATSFIDYSFWLSLHRLQRKMCKCRRLAVNWFQSANIAARATVTLLAFIGAKDSDFENCIGIIFVIVALRAFQIRILRIESSIKKIRISNTKLAVLILCFAAS